jgi:ABC-type antimicrobial peptide transport system, permease component
MRFTEIIHLVWINIIQTKTKVLLTSLGVIVGAATIVLVIAIGNGGKEDVQNQFKTLNVGAIQVSVSTQADMQDEMMGGMMGGPDGGGMPGGGGFPGGGAAGGGGSKSGRGSAGGGMPGGGGFPGGGSSTKAQKGVTLTTTDVDDIVSYVPNLTSASIISSGTGAVLTDELDAETDETVVGCLPEYQSISNLEMLTGSFISQDDQENKSKVAVIGYKLAKTLFGSAYAAYGSDMTIEGKTYTVEGVLAEMGSVSSGISPDDSIYLPYSTANKFVLGSSATPTITAIASDVTQIETAMTNIKAVLTENYPSGKFTLTDAGAEMEAATASANTLSMLLISVAIVVFIVGGIGIMNVLFVSVKERTQEIGILKALGCNKREILLEFLTEANLIGVFGGFVGLIAGYGLVPILRLTGMTVSPSSIGGILALAFAIITGTAFGFYPAYKAAQLTPIEALSQE